MPNNVDCRIITLTHTCAYAVQSSAILLLLGQINSHFFCLFQIKYRMHLSSKVDLFEDTEFNVLAFDSDGKTASSKRSTLLLRYIMYYIRTMPISKNQFVKIIGKIFFRMDIVENKTSIK